MLVFINSLTWQLYSSSFPQNRSESATDEVFLAPTALPSGAMEEPPETVPDHQSLPVILDEKRKRIEESTAEANGEKKAADEKQRRKNLKQLQQQQQQQAAAEGGDKGPADEPQWVQGSVINPEGFKVEGNHTNK